MEPCARCGTFIAPGAGVDLDGKWYCRSCAARPDVDYLEAFRRKYWGKRDLLAWMMGLMALLNSTIAVGAALEGRWIASAVLFAWGLILGACFFGQRWARIGIVVAVLASAAVGLVTGGLAGASGFIFPLLLAVGSLANVRTKLFFKIAVPRPALRRAWDRYCNNAVARAGMSFGMMSLFLPPLALIGMGCSIMGLTQVDPTAHPPIGKRAHAIAGIVLSSLGMAMGVVWWRALSP